MVLHTWKKNGHIEIGYTKKRNLSSLLSKAPNPLQIANQKKSHQKEQNVIKMWNKKAAHKRQNCYTNIYKQNLLILHNSYDKKKKKSML